jgi:hypothetical protein
VPTVSPVTVKFVAVEAERETVVQIAPLSDECSIT